MANDETKQPAAETEKKAIDIMSILPEGFAAKLKDGSFKDAEEANGALVQSFKDLLKIKGFDDVKTTQTGTHMAIKKQLAEAVKELDLDLEIADMNTADAIKSIKDKVADIKKAAPKSGLTEDEKKAIADLKTLQKALEESNKKVAEAEQKLKAKESEVEQTKTALIRNQHAEKVLAEAVKSTANARLSTVKEAAIERLFADKYVVDAELDEQGKPKGHALRLKATNEIAFKNGSNILSIEDALLGLYKEYGFSVAQAEQKSPVNSAAPTQTSAKKANIFTEKPSFVMPFPSQK